MEFVEREPLTQDPLSYDQVLVETTWLHPNRALPDTIQSIQWSTQYTEWAVDMLIASQIEKIEHSRSIKVNRDNQFPGEQRYKVIVDTNPTVGTDTSVVTATKIYSRNGVPIDRIATVMHTHGKYNTPPSPKDCEVLLLSGDTIRAHTCVCVLTHAQKYLIFRGSQSPQYSASDTLELLQQWEAEGKNKSATSHDQDVVSQIALLFQKAHQFHWHIFSAPTGTDIFTRVRDVQELTWNLPPMHR